MAHNDNSKDKKQDAALWTKRVAAIANSADEAAFHSLYGYFAPRVKSFMLRSGLGPDAAEDIAQETMIIVWRKAAQFNPNLASVSTWIFTIARNKKIDKFRKDARPLPDANDPTYFWSLEQTPETALQTLEVQGKIEKALAQLPTDQRLAVTLSFLKEKPHKDIAQSLGIPLGTVKSRIRLGMKRLYEILGTKGGDNE